MATSKSHGFWELVKTIVYAVLIAVVVRTFLFEPFSIPSGSMIPTLLVGDYSVRLQVLVRFQPLFAAVRPAAVLRAHLGDARPSAATSSSSSCPTDNSTDYIKRVIGLARRSRAAPLGAPPHQRPAGSAGAGGAVRRAATAGFRSDVPALSGDFAERARARDHRDQRQRPVRQHRRLHRAGRALLPHGRQSRQLPRQPLSRRGRLRAVRKPDRQGANHLLLRRRATR